MLQVKFKWVIQVYVFSRYSLKKCELGFPKVNNNIFVKFKLFTKLKTKRDTA